jgi:hypothetical protein
LSQQARDTVVNSKATFFQAQSQVSDLENPALTDSNLIAAAQYILDGGFAFEFTAVRTDHHDDGPTGHAGGLAFDGWPLASNAAGDYLDASDQKFKDFLVHVGKFPGLYQLGLAGTAYSAANVIASGLPEDFAKDPCVFHDGGADHVHIGVHPA